MKIFKVGFECEVCYSVNMIWANTGKEEREAVEETAARRAERYGYTVAFVEEISECEANSNLEKGMPYYGIDEQAERDHDPSFAEEAAEAAQEQKTEGGEETAPSFTISHNDEYNSTEVSFAGKPSEEVRVALKALRFRWHGQRRVWYGYKDEQTVREAIEGKKPAETPAQIAQKPTSETAQDHIRIYWNGIKIDGGKLIRCFYSINNNAQISGDCVSIHARDYSDLPRDILPVTNDSDIYTDYFDNDHATVTPEHPLFKYFLYAAKKAMARDAKKHAEYCRDNLNKPERWSGQHDMYKGDLANDEKEIAEYNALRDPGQPTAEDLAELDRQRLEAENARRAAEHAEELRQREIYLNQRADGRRLIETEAEAHPISEDAPAVLINWSEHPAFDAYADDELTLSVAAAENILRKLDETQHNTRETENGRGLYYKTKFTITGKDESGESFTYTGRYDLGDGDGGLIRHIRALGEYYLAHDQFGHTLTEPGESNGVTELADYLERFTA